MSKKPVVLMVLDGYGLSDKTEGNAVALAKKGIHCRHRPGAGPDV